MASGKLRKVRCIETGEVYNSCAEAGRAIGVSASLVNKVVSGEKKSAKGLHFEDVEENLMEGEGLTLTVQNEQEGEVPFDAFAVTNEQEQGIIPLTVQNAQGETVPVIDSREVARMMGKAHKEILMYIEGKTTKDKTYATGILPTLLSKGFDLSAYFIESSYTNANNRRERCYLCTRMGCDLLATRQKGEKGILFCAKYVERFNTMEKELKSKSVHQYPELTEKQQCILAVYDGGASAVAASKRLVEIEVQEATAPLKAELTQSKAELTEKKDFIDDINDCFTFTQVKQYNKQLLRDRKDIVLSTAKLNEVAAELGIPVNKIDNPIEHSPYRRINAYPRKVWMTAYPDIKLPEKESK